MLKFSQCLGKKYTLATPLHIGRGSNFKVCMCVCVGGGGGGGRGGVIATKILAEAMRQDYT